MNVIDSIKSFLSQLVMSRTNSISKFVILVNADINSYLLLKTIIDLFDINKIVGIIIKRPSENSKNAIALAQHFSIEYYLLDMMDFQFVIHSKKRMIFDDNTEEKTLPTLFFSNLIHSTTENILGIIPYSLSQLLISEEPIMLSHKIVYPLASFLQTEINSISIQHNFIEKNETIFGLPINLVDSIIQKLLKNKPLDENEEKYIDIIDRVRTKISLLRRLGVLFWK